MSEPGHIWETTVRLVIKRSPSEEQARAEVDEFREISEIEIVPIGGDEARLATQAFANYSKGRHPAALNMGDCLAYACAKVNEMPLLFVGNDFSQTDVNAGYEGA